MSTSRALVAAALLLAGCKQAFPSVPGAGADQIRFPHQTHKDAGAECAQCHQAVIESDSLRKAPKEGFGPKEAVCLDCHGDQKESGNCQFCHTNPDKAGKKIPAEQGLIFPHTTHNEATGGECSTCHKQLPEIGKPAPAPTMDTCFECHADDNKASACGKCHVDLKRFPLKPVSDYAHEGGFLERHAGAARSAPQNCAQCHEKTYCATCHAAATRPLPPGVLMPEQPGAEFIHRSGYVSRHMIEASADPASCRRCHGQEYCSNCHKSHNRTSDSKNPRDPHPAGWSYPGSASFHGEPARTEIASCAACHDQGAASNCVSCHKVGAIGGNPHPASWNSKHNKSEINGNGMCLYCHP